MEGKTCSYKMKEYDIIIIGAGAAGLIGAIESYSPSNKICILEKMEKPAKKLEISGKGRCNITNSAELKDFLSHFGNNGRFLRYSFSSFFNEQLLKYFEDLGVNFKLERGGRYFPESDRSEELVNALINKIDQLKIPVYTNSKVLNISKKENIFSVLIENNKKTISCKKILIATGGKSYPNTGSSGDGYRFAGKFGHSISTILPALVPLKIEGDIPKKLNDLALKNISVSVWSEKNGVRKKNREEFGEMEFRQYGVTGPVILTISKDIVELLNENFEVSILIDLKPALDHKKIDNRILREIKENPNLDLKHLISKLLPMKMISVFLNELDISEKKKLNQINSNERKKIRLLLKEFTLNVTGFLSYNNAIITNGGIITKEINPKTMESKMIDGLYFAGEIIDIDADTGGFNLQAAFSTGYIAGRSMR